MLEAMAYGNAVVSRNVGDTWKFLKNNYNGYMPKDDYPSSLSAVLYECMQVCKYDMTFGDRSRELVEKDHNFENFSIEIDSFWSEVLFKQSTSSS